MFTSSYGVLGLTNSYKENHFLQKLAFCIGEKTQSTAKRLGFKTIVSEKSTYDSLIQLICEFYKNK